MEMKNHLSITHTPTPLLSLLQGGINMESELDELEVKEEINEQLKSLRLEQEIMAHGSMRIKALFDAMPHEVCGIKEYDDMLAARVLI